MPRLGYTAFVRVLRVALPVAALVIVGVVFARLAQNPMQQIENTLEKKEKTIPGQIEVTGAQYEGADAQGHPYTLIAARASRVEGPDDAARLEGLKADVTLEDGSWISVQAATGLYAVARKHIDLKDGVTVYHDSGYEARLRDIGVDLDARKAVTTAPVTASGPLGDIAAAGLETFDRGDRVVFTGPVTVRLNRLGKAG